VVTVLLNGVVFGIVTNTFSTLREAREAITSDITSRCCICGVNRNDLEKDTQSFQAHVGGVHNLWSYMYLCIYLRRSDEREMSSFEADVWAEINDTANPTFRWLSFDMVKSKSEEDLGSVDPLALAPEDETEASVAVDPDIVKLSESIIQAAYATIGAIASNTIAAPAFGMLLSTLHAAPRLPWPLMTLRDSSVRLIQLLESGEAEVPGKLDPEMTAECKRVLSNAKALLEEYVNTNLLSKQLRRLRLEMRAVRLNREVCSALGEAQRSIVATLLQDRISQLEDARQRDTAELAN